jgi:hypothetical protein
MTARLLDQPHKHFVGPLIKPGDYPPLRKSRRRAHNPGFDVNHLDRVAEAELAQVGDFVEILMSTHMPERTSEKGSIA